MLVSGIIPALNEAENIQQCIAAAQREYSSDELETIVVDGGSSDGTRELVPPGVTVLTAPRGRAGQMNLGARVSSGEILVFCHADSQLPAGWREAVIEALSGAGVSGGAFETLVLPEKGLLRLGNRMRTPAHWTSVYGDQVQFMTRGMFRQVGGFPEIPLMEDVEMARTLHKAGKLVRIPLRVITSSRRFEERGVLRQTLQNLWNKLSYLYLGATPQDIARRYVSSRERAE